ncbi:MAG: hypothetical protein L0Y56_11490 [Nitrospira sp.]|nr:hypothetical protein [Nitrospira sp.]
MRVRRLQSLADDDQQWLDEAYVYEKPDGSVRFRYNPMVWEGIGPRHNRTLKAQGTPLEIVETVILTGDRLRWLDIEEIEGDPEEIKTRLNEACGFPKPEPAAIAKPEAV